MASRAWLAALILLSAGLFAVGSAIERSKHEKGTPGASAGAETRSEGGGSAAHRAAEPGSGATESGGESHAESSEDIFGVNPQSKGLVIAAIVAAVLLAAAVWIRAIAGLMLRALASR